LLVGSINPDTTTITQGRRIESQAKDLETVAKDYDKMRARRIVIVEGCKKIRLSMKGSTVEKLVTPASDPLVQACVEAEILKREVNQQNIDIKQQVENKAKETRQNQQKVSSIKK
jgi:hypothetical protein